MREADEGVRRGESRGEERLYCVHKTEIRGEKSEDVRGRGDR